MRPLAGADQVRAAEQAWFDAHPEQPGLLMERAAHAVAKGAAEMLTGAVAGPVLVVAGRGNNAGDALFAAAELAAAHPGREVLVWVPLEQTHREGLRAVLGAGARVVTRAEAQAAVGEAALVVDGLFGIGGRPGLPPAVAEFATACRERAVPLLAVDLPSGLDADSGSTDCDHLPATRTVTFVALKAVHVLQPAASACGVVALVDIDVEVGSPQGWCWEPPDVAAILRWPDSGSDKYSRGVVGLDTGSTRYPGAGVLSALGAQHAGAGMLRCAAPQAVAERVLDRLPSVVTAEGRVQAWVVGSGWGDDPSSADRFTRRVGDGVPLVVDADALTHLDPDRRPLPNGSVLTPHAGELARLLGVERREVEADPMGHARRAARHHNAVVLLKGATQLVVPPSGPVAIAVGGPAWTAQAGSGDVLAGICGTLLAAGLGPVDAAAAAASLQAMTASRHPGPWPPDRIAQWLPETIADLAPDRLRGRVDCARDEEAGLRS